MTSYYRRSGVSEVVDRYGTCKRITDDQGAREGAGVALSGGWTRGQVEVEGGAGGGEGDEGDMGSSEPGRQVV